MSLPPLKIKVSDSICRGTKRINRSLCKYYFIYGNKYRQESSYCQGCIFLRETMVYFLYMSMTHLSKTTEHPETCATRPLIRASSLFVDEWPLIISYTPLRG